jgi:hypothetical protein
MQATQARQALGAHTQGGDVGMMESGSAERTLRTLETDQAASLLGVSPHTLLAWEARYGFPTSAPAEPRYSQAEVLALRDSLREGASIAWAITRARETIKRRAAPGAVQWVDQRGG